MRDSTLRHNSRQLFDDVSRLLLRFGVSTVISTVDGLWELAVGVDDQRRFLQEIAVHRERAPAADALLTIVRERSGAGVPATGGGDAEGAPRNRVTIRPEDLGNGFFGDKGYDLERVSGCSTASISTWRLPTTCSGTRSPQSRRMVSKRSMTQRFSARTTSSPTASRSTTPLSRMPTW